MARTVLLIDYSPRSISRIRTLLQTTGYRIIVAHDAAEGMEEFRNATPELTLIQDLLPKGHGYEVCREMKDSEHGHRSPVILLTAPRSGGRRHELLQTRCDDFVEKPFSDEALLTAVRKILPAEVVSAAPVPAPAMAQAVAQSVAPAAAPAAAPAPMAAIPVQFTDDDIGAALDMILPGLPEKKEEPIKAEEVVAEPKNGKRRSLKTLLKRKRKPKSKKESAAKPKTTAKREGKATKKKKSTRKRASIKKVPAPA
jgi:CheY-like chemotaxis protein